MEYKEKKTMPKDFEFIAERIEPEPHKLSSYSIKFALDAAWYLPALCIIVYMISKMYKH
jgi:hypothetical protein